ncbi:MAG: urea ABC transporter permease subunit UrtB, partial [Kiloniellales bacterium]|nr:urea ABC transporter permease subunit UrtB [Kiloniellales bacterium]
MPALFKLFRLRVLAVLVFLLVPSAASAELAQDLQALTEKSNATKAAAVESLAAGGHERATPILQAFLAGRLFQVKEDDRIVVAEDSSGGYRIFDAMTGEALGEVGKRKLRKVRINNRLR